MYQINFLELYWLAILEYMYKYIYIYIFCFDILIFFVFFFYVQKFVIGLTVRDNDQSRCSVTLSSAFISSYHVTLFYDIHLSCYHHLFFFCISVVCLAVNAF